MLATITIILTFYLGIMAFLRARDGFVECAQIYGGLCLCSFGACLAIDGSTAWATGLLLLGAGVIFFAGRD